MQIYAVEFNHIIFFYSSGICINRLLPLITNNKWILLKTILCIRRIMDCLQSSNSLVTVINYTKFYLVYLNNSVSILEKCLKEDALMQGYFKFFVTQYKSQHEEQFLVKISNCPSGFNARCTMHGIFRRKF